MMLEPRPARLDELVGALELLFRHLTPAERAYRVTKGVELAQRGDLDLRGVLVVPPSAVGSIAACPSPPSPLPGGERGESVCSLSPPSPLPGGERGEPHGVFVCQLVPGGGSLVWPPSAHGNVALEDQLIRAGCAWLRQQGARLAQCLLAEEEVSLAESLLRNGFKYITDLNYLCCRLLGQYPALPKTLQLETYNEQHPEEFHTTLARSYEQSLDCPEVNGSRSIDEVIQGHRAQGVFDPSRWWLIRQSGTAAAVLLLAEPTPGEWEVAYLGVVPEARRLGIGRAVLWHALRTARQARADRVVLSVDVRNVPAVRLYNRIGFSVYDRRRVLLALWNSAKL